MSGCRDYNSKVSLSPPRLATPPPKEHYIAHFAAVPIASCIRRASRSHRLLGRGGGGGGGGRGHVIGANQWLADTFTWRPDLHRYAPAWITEASRLDDDNDPIVAR